MVDGNLRSVLPKGTKVYLSGASSSSTRKGILDPSNEEPWTAPSLPASIHFTFSEPIRNATHIALTFQGGFVGTEAILYAATQGKDNESEVQMGLMMGGKIFPEDKNKRQVFKIVYPPTTQNRPLVSDISSLPTISTPSGPQIQTEVPPNPHGAGKPAEPLVNGVDGELDAPNMTEFKIEFEKSSDQYGRVTLYSIELLG